MEKAVIIKFKDATNEQLQIAARSIGGDEVGLMDIIEADDLDETEVQTLIEFLMSRNIKRLFDDGGWIRVEYQ